MATASEQKPGPGRPSDYDPQKVDKILDALYRGESLRALCRKGEVPPRRTIYHWLESNEEFRHQYARAREAGMDERVEEIREIADNEDGDVQRDRLRVDTRKWEATKIYPKQYGDKSVTELQGKDGGAIALQMTDEECARRMAFLMADLMTKGVKP